jgi:hypothetical protein
MEALIGLVYIGLVTASISSMWLFSPMFEFLREQFLEVPYIKHLAICQICCAFWIAIPVTLVIMEGPTVLGVILHAFCAAFISWSLGAWTTKNLWERAFHQRTVQEYDR